MSESASEPLSAVDAAWLRMDRPGNLMMICGMMLLDGRLELARFKELLRSRMLCFHRFRQRVVLREGEPYWEADPDFDLGRHVRRLGPAGGVPAAQLARMTSRLAGTPLPADRPRWQFHVIDVEGGSAVVLRIHHCYCDGFALLHVLDAVTDPGPDQAPRRPADVAPPAMPRSAWERVLGPVAESVADAVRASLTLAGQGREALDYAKPALDLLRQAGVLAGMTPDAPSALKGEAGSSKLAAWGAPLPLFEVKAVAEALGCSVNDVLLACIAGTLRAWLQERGETVEDKEIRALVPVNLRPPGPLAELGNDFGLVFLGLPVGIAEPLPRLMEVHRRMDALKHSQQPLLALGILAAMGIAPEILKERLLETLAANASLVVTNVHGPDRPRYVAGRRIARQLFWVPQSGGIGLGVSILSYDGGVGFGVLADAHRIPDAGTLPGRFADEFAALLLAALSTPP